VSDVCVCEATFVIFVKEFGEEVEDDIIAHITANYNVLFLLLLSV